MTSEQFEPKYIVDNSDETYTLGQMAEANKDDPYMWEMIARLLPLKKGEHTFVGGGAQPRIKITRIQ